MLKIKHNAIPSSNHEKLKAVVGRLHHIYPFLKFHKLLRCNTCVYIHDMNTLKVTKLHLFFWQRFKSACSTSQNSIYLFNRSSKLLVKHRQKCTYNSKIISTLGITSRKYTCYSKEHVQICSLSCKIAPIHSEKKYRKIEPVIQKNTFKYKFHLFIQQQKSSNPLIILANCTDSFKK